MQIGACVWNFNQGPYCAPYEDAIRTASRLGFAGVEMMIYSADDIATYYTSAKLAELTALLDDHGLAVPQVSVYDHALHDLASQDSAKKRQALDNFERCVEITKRLGSPIVNTVSQWPEDLAAPIPYPPSMIYTDLRGMNRLSPKLTMSLPADWRWEAVWDNYVDSFRRCLEVAQANELFLAIEGHCHVVVSGADAMLRFIEHLDYHPNLAVNLDTGWHMRQREYLPMSIYKLRGRIRGLHVRDTDGLLNYGLPPGQGIVDWRHVIQALRDVGYDGFLTLEMANQQDPEQVFGEARKYLEALLRDA